MSGEPEQLVNEDEEQTVERVAAIDVAKGSGQVCARVPRASIAGRRVTSVWNIPATTNAIAALAERLAGEGIERVVESTSDYWLPFVYLLQAQGRTSGLSTRARSSRSPVARRPTSSIRSGWRS